MSLTTWMSAPVTTGSEPGTRRSGWCAAAGRPESADRAGDEESVVLADTGEMLALFGLGESNPWGWRPDDQPSVLLPDDRADVMPEDVPAEASAGDVVLNGARRRRARARYDGVEVLGVRGPSPASRSVEDHTDGAAPVAGSAPRPRSSPEEDRIDVLAPEGRSGALAAVWPVRRVRAGRERLRRAPPATTYPWTTRLVGSDWFVRTGSTARGLRVEQTSALVCGSIRRAACRSRRGVGHVRPELSPRTTGRPSLAASVAELEAAEADATEPYGLMEAAFADYDAAVLSARAAADSAAPALASVAGMADETALAAANAALAALVAQLDTTTPAAPPGPYERGDVDMTDVDELAAATQTATNRAERIATATRECAGRAGCARREGRRAHGCPGRARIFAARDRGDHRRCEPAGRAELPRCGDRCVRRRGRGPGRRRLGRCRTARVRRGRDRAARGSGARSRREATTPVTPPSSRHEPGSRRLSRYLSRSRRRAAGLQPRADRAGADRAVRRRIRRAC